MLGKRQLREQRVAGAERPGLQGARRREHSQAKEKAREKARAEIASATSGEMGKTVHSGIGADSNTAAARALQQ